MPGTTILEKTTFRIAQSDESSRERELALSWGWFPDHAAKNPTPAHFRGCLCFLIVFSKMAVGSRRAKTPRKVPKNMQIAPKSIGSRGKKLELLPGFGPGTSSIPTAGGVSAGAFPGVFCALWWVWNYYLGPFRPCFSTGDFPVWVGKWVRAFPTLPPGSASGTPPY